MTGGTLRRLCWPAASWPEADRHAWTTATTPMALMAYRRRHGTKLGAETLRKIVKGYGRWLSFLNDRYGDSLAEPPDSRVTVPRLRTYFRALQHAGNAHGTIAGRFYELQAALRLIAPDFDGEMIRHLDGATMRQRLDLTPHDVTVPPVEELMDWGLGMMQQADQLADPRRRLTSYRDGLMITVLAARGRRRRSMATIRDGYELQRCGDVYVVELSADLVKTERPDSFSLPAELTPYLDHYLQNVRPALMCGRDHDALWVTSSGAPMNAHDLTNRLIELTPRRFGFSFGPHRFPCNQHRSCPSCP